MATWTPITLSIEVPPSFYIGSPPPVIEPDVPTEPDVTIEKPIPEYTYIETEMPESTTITIAEPPDITIQDLLITIPSFDATVPDHTVKWAYAQYTNTILDIIALQTDNLNEKFDTLGLQWGTNNDNIWTKKFNLITAMGWDDCLATYEGKELAYGKSLYRLGYDTLYEAVKTKNTRLYIDTKLNIERQKRTQYAMKKDTELVWAKDIVQKSLEQYNFAIRVYGTKINEYKAHVLKFRSLIDTNNLRLKILGQQLDREQAKIDVNKNLITRYKTEISVLVGQIRLYESQMQLAEKLIRLDAIELELFKEETNAFIASVKAITERARQQTILSEVDVIRAELTGADAAYQELVALKTTAEVELQAAQQRFNALYSASIIKGQSLAEIASAIAEKGNANVQLQAAQVTEATARGDRSLASDEMTKERTNADLREDILDTKNLVTMAKDDTESKDKIADYQKRPYTAEQQAAFLDYFTELGIIEILRKAEIINRFIESIGHE